MAKVSIYLNFMGNTREAFEYYKTVFKTEFSAPIMFNRDIPEQPGVPMPPMSEEDKNKVMHVSLPILGGTLLMGTDMLESMGHKLVIGNNTTISLEPDSKQEVDRLYSALCQGGKDGMAPQEMFWGYWGTCQDRFGVRWMFNYLKPVA
jgi:PhnB protein